MFNNSPISCFVGLTNTALNLCQCLSTFLIFPLGSFPRSGDIGLKVKETRLLIYCQIAFQKRHPSFYSSYKRMCVSLIQKKRKKQKNLFLKLYQYGKQAIDSYYLNLYFFYIEIRHFFICLLAIYIFSSFSTNIFHVFPYQIEPGTIQNPISITHELPRSGVVIQSQVLIHWI